MDEKMEKTKELDKIQPEKITLMIHGEEREIKFGFSAWAAIEREYGGIQNIDKIQKEIEEKPFETIPYLVYIGLTNKEGVNRETVLDEYGLNDILMITEKLTQALYGSLPADEGKKAEVEAK